MKVIAPPQEREPRPAMRGILHLVAALVAPVALVALMLAADSPRRYVGAAIFASGLILLYATSASYHLVPWRERLRAIIMRIDHSMIFILIAATYTPFCLIVLSNAWGIPMLSLVWSFAGLGVFLKVLWPSAPRWLSVSLYLALGWVGIVAAGPLVSGLETNGLTLLVLGGVLYSLGGIVYALRRPDPFPRFFGFHEVFHTFVVAGSIAHFSVIAAFLI